MRFFSFSTLSFIVWVSGTIATAQDLNVAEVVAVHNAFNQNPNEQTREHLFAVLEQYENEPTIESVNAHLAILLSDTADSKYKDMRESALLTAAHLEPVSEILPKHYIEAKYIAAIALFSHKQDRVAMLEMAHVEGFTRQHVNENGEHPDWASDLRWKSDAWGLAMQAYFRSMRKSYPSDDEIDAILMSYGIDEDALLAQAMKSEGEAGLPQCPGRMIQLPKLRYPKGKAMRGMFGAVLLGLEFDAEGKVVDPKVLASVPIEEFNDKSLRVVKQWRYEPDEPDQVGVSCRLERAEVVQPLVFQIR